MKREIKKRIINYLTFLENEFKDFPEYENLTWDIYYKDRRKRREVERWIENLINSVVDIAKIIIGEEGYELPETYREIVKFLELLKPFNKRCIELLSRYTKLRNIITHEYIDIKWNSIENFIKNSGEIFPIFISSVKKYLKRKIKKGREK